MHQTTIKYDRLKELCVLMEGLLHIMETRQDQTVQKLLERYVLEYDALIAPLLAQQQTPAQPTEKETEVHAETEDIPDVDQTVLADAVLEEEAADADIPFTAIHEEEPAPEQPTAPQPSAETHPDIEAQPIDEEQPMSEPQPETETEQQPEAIDEPAVHEQASDKTEPAHSRESEPAQSREPATPAGKAPVTEPTAMPQYVADDDVITYSNELRVDEMLSRREARSLRRAFTINDKFRFRRELFGNDDKLFGNTIDMIEALKNMDDAIVYMRDDLGWNLEDDNVKDFAAIVANHFAEV